MNKEKSLKKQMDESLNFSIWQKSNKIIITASKRKGKSYYSQLKKEVENETKNKKRN